MNDARYKHLSFYFPFIERHAVKIEEVGNWVLVAHLDNGDSVLYDDYTQTIRNLPKDPNNMSEDECRKEFGLRLRELLFKKHITQKDLALMTGIDGSLLSAYVNGTRSPSFYKVDLIAKALDCSVDEFRYL